MTAPTPGVADTPATREALRSLRSVGASAGADVTVPIAGDILYGAEEIAVFLFGERKHRRRVYNLVDGNGLPVFRIGVNICARKSVLLEWIMKQERGNMHDDPSANVD